MKKGKVGWNSENLTLPLNVNVFLCMFSLISPSLWPNSGYWCCTFLILCLMSLKFWHLEIIQLLPNLKNTTILIDCMGCRILGISYSLEQNDTQTKVFEKFWSIKGQKASCFVKKIDIIFFCFEFIGTSQSINLSSTVWDTLQNLCKCFLSRLIDPNPLQFSMLIHGFS
jgi:hypothetical protein